MYYLCICNTPSMRLTDLKTGEQGIIVRVYGKGSFRRRIVEMGFINGEKITVIQNAPMHDPVEYEVMGYRVSLRREEAALVDVVSVNDATGEPGEDLKGIPNDKQAASTLGHSRTLHVALVGNPNCGKTSLFNSASGGHERVGNYAGVTVGSKERDFDYGGYHIRLIDLPGTYSLTSYSPEEVYVRQYILDKQPDVVINVLDATNLKRNLYLTTQLIDMDISLVCALNMWDDLERLGDKLDRDMLGVLLGLPIVPTVSRDGRGIEALLNEVIATYEGRSKCRHIHINHGQLLEQEIGSIQREIKKSAPGLLQYSSRYLAIKWLEQDKTTVEYLTSLLDVKPLLRGLEHATRLVNEQYHENMETAFTEAKYAFISGALKETLREHEGKRHPHTERIDMWMTNRWLSYPIFIVILFVIFEATFVLGEYPMKGIEWLVNCLGQAAWGLLAPGPLRDLITQGIIGGVGSVIVFLPNILILYLFISILEDTGYMARAVFIMDRIMHRLGLHGKSFIPLVMGFGCNVPAIMATRTIESRKGRLITMLITPFMSCSARLPLFIVILGACFPTHAGLILSGLYALGIIVAIISARLFSRFLVKRPDAPFVMELPPYRTPSAKSVLRHTWEKGYQYLKKIGGIILIASIIIWFLGYFPRGEAGMSQSAQLENSYIGVIGKAIAPALQPLGFDWKQNVGLLAGVGAKELVVSTMGVIYANDDSGNETVLSDHLAGSLTVPVALAYMVFVLLYFPCLATLAAIKNESGHWHWALFAALYTTAVAWIASFLVLHIALLFV